MTRFAVVYDEATRPCAKGPQPGTVALSQGVMHARPGIGTLGIFNCRDVVGTLGTPSVHGNGRAWDAKPATRARGDQLALELVAHHVELGVQAVIWWRRAWSVLRPYWHAYDGTDPHTGHLHIEQNKAAAAALTVGAVLAALDHEQDEENEMPYTLLADVDGDPHANPPIKPGKVYMVTPAGLVYVTGPTSLEQLRDAGVASHEPPDPMSHRQLVEWLKTTA